MSNPGSCKLHFDTYKCKSIDNLYHNMRNKHHLAPHQKQKRDLPNSVESFAELNKTQPILHFDGFTCHRKVGKRDKCKLCILRQEN